VRVRSAVVVVVVSVLGLSGCGRSHPTRVAGERPCQRHEPLRAIAREGEYLHAGYLPPGVTLRTGDEHNPYASHSVISYGSATPNGPNVELRRVFTTEAPDRYLMTNGPGVTTADGVIHSPTTDGTTVHGKPGVILISGGIGLINIDWKERPEVTLGTTTHNIDRTEAERVAEGVVYEPGRLGRTSTDCHQLPPGAVSRQSIEAKFRERSGGERVSTKLVRVADLMRGGSNFYDCVRVCEPGLVTWLVLEQGDFGPMRHPPSLAPTTEGPHASWTMTAVDAATGEARGGFGTGSGNPPAFFDSIEDVAPS